LGAALTLAAVPSAQATDAAAIKDWFARCTQDGTDTQTCAATLEARALAAADNQVQRQGRTLVVSTAQGPVRFEDPVSATVIPVHHYYLGLMDGTDLQVVWAATAERFCSRYWLVSTHSGRPLPVDNLPWVSASGDHLVILAGDGKRRPSSVTLLTRTPDAWTQVWRFEPAGDAVYTFKGWLTDNAVELEVQSRSDHRSGAGRGRSQRMLLRDGEHGWELAGLPAR
jgi:hypothetical protein